MHNIYIRKISIHKVRHIENIDIPINDNSKKHLILTGKNGSGKTILLQTLAEYLNCLVTNDDFEKQGLDVELNVEKNV